MGKSETIGTEVDTRNLKVHFVNSGPRFPYAYYLGVLSAAQAYGSENVKLWLAERPTGRYFDLIEKKVEVVSYPYKIPAFPVLEGREERFKRIQIFNHCVWRLMAEQGGTLMGLDSFTITPFQDLLEADKELLLGIDSPNSKTGWDFLMEAATARAGSPLVQAIYEDSFRALHGECPKGKHAAVIDGKLRFGGSGIIPMLNHALVNLNKLSMAEFGILSGFHHRETLHPDCRFVPYYAYSMGNFFKGITEHNVLKNRTPMAATVKALPKDIWHPIPATAKRSLYTFHLLGLVHLPVSEKFMGCAFTQKIVKMSKMLLSLGHEVYLYGAEGSGAPCTEFIQTHTLSEIARTWGDGDNRPECDDLGYQWRKTGFRHDFNGAKTKLTRRFYAKCTREINKRKRKDDFLLLMQGQYHKPIADQVKLWLTCEPGVGYRGSYTRFKAFESAYLRNFTYGSRAPFQSVDGDWYDRTIPNYFDPKDFPFRADKEDYYLYIGRLIQRKGIWIAEKTVRAIGGKLIVAGQGDYKLDPAVCEYVGYVDPPERARLMGGARAIFVPTIYLEVFAGVHIEANLCGTPCITTDFGVFEGSVRNGINGYRCNTLQDFVDAARAVEHLDPHIVRQSAERYLMENVKQEFGKWFENLYQLYRSAHEQGVKGWHYLGDNNGK